MTGPRPRLDAYAESFARTAIENIRRPYPQRVDGVITADHPYVEPSRLHPAFHGSFDWHSCVHMHWLLVRLLVRFAEGSWRAAAIDTLHTRLTATKVNVECAFFQSPGNEVFERPYGWAWLLKLHAELTSAVTSGLVPDASAWSDGIEPLSRLLRERFLAYLDNASYPIRAGTHANSAFAMLMGLDFASALDDAHMHDAIAGKALLWFAQDIAYPAVYEPDGEDFLSGGLLEAALMARLLDRSRFDQWWNRFRPDDAGISHWQTPVTAMVRDDAKLVHLDGLNLSRAWCWRSLVKTLPDSMASAATEAANRHLLVSLPHTIGSNYAGSHWLASFATLALCV